VVRIFITHRQQQNNLFIRSLNWFFCDGTKPKMIKIGTNITASVKGPSFVWENSTSFSLQLNVTASNTKTPLSLLWSISSTIYSHVFCTKVLSYFRLSQNVTREKLRKSILYKKVVCKMLMKLTPVAHVVGPVKILVFKGLWIVEINWKIYSFRWFVPRVVFAFENRDPAGVV